MTELLFRENMTNIQDLLGTQWSIEGRPYTITKVDIDISSYQPEYKMTFTPLFTLQRSDSFDSESVNNSSEETDNNTSEETNDNEWTKLLFDTTD